MNRFPIPRSAGVLRAGFLLLGLMAMLLALSACSIGQPKPAKQTYSLSAPEAEKPAGGTQVPATLQIAAVKAPYWLNTSRMYYQLAYAESNRIAAYSESRWLVSPSAMMQKLLLESISARGGWHAVVGPGSLVKADYVLHVRLLQFRQVFKSRDDSAGVIEARASLETADAGKLVAQRDFHLQAKAPTADAPGGVDALNRASHQFLKALTQWLIGVAGSQPADKQ